jgi:hypothetical protein
MTIRIYGEIQEIGINFFDDIKILEVTIYTSTVFIDYVKVDWVCKGITYHKDKILTLSMDSDDYLKVKRHLRIKSLGI